MLSFTLQNHHMKNILILLLALAVTSCKNEETKSTQSATTVTTTDTVATTPPKETGGLKNCEINDQYFNEKTPGGRILSEKEIVSMGLTDIEDINKSMSSKIKVIDTIFTNAESKMIIVSVEEESGNAAYLVQLNNKNKLFAFEDVYVSKMEGQIYQVSTKITDRKVEIAADNDNGDGKPATKVTTLNLVNGKLQKAG